MTKVSDRLNRLAESATLAMARMSRELQAKGIDVIALSLGEPDFDTPEFIKEAAKKAIDDNFRTTLQFLVYQSLEVQLYKNLKEIMT